MLRLPGSLRYQAKPALCRSPMLPRVPQRWMGDQKKQKPTGVVHIGNYLGAIKQWVDMQHDHSEGSDYEKPLYCVVDLHSLTTPKGRVGLYENTLNMTAMLLACGLDPKKCIIYNQSKVPGHSELMWILSSFTAFNHLNTMIQFKEKAKTQNEAYLGLLSYPVLMAADILLFKATHVPVGEDQIQHMELTSKLARRYNDLFAPNFFPVPECIQIPDVTRVLSLTSHENKMSKSDPFPKSRIDMLDSNELIIKKAKTDSIEGITYDASSRPEVANLVRIFAAVTNKTSDEIASSYASTRIDIFKNDLADAIIAHIGPIRDQAEDLYHNNRAYLEEVLAAGGAEANEISMKTLEEVRKQVGLV